MKKGGLAGLRRVFITGVLTITPVALGVFILYRLFLLFDKLLQPILRPLLVRYVGHYLPGLGLLALILLILFVGLLTRLYLGRKLIDLGQSMLDRIPFLSKLVLAIRQILESLLSDNKELFRHAVLIQYPRQGIWSVGFATRRTEGEIPEHVGRELISIFVPTTPNPTSGMLVFLPRDEVIYLKLTVEEALKLVISAGVHNPEVEGLKSSRAASDDKPAVSATELFTKPLGKKPDKSADEPSDKPRDPAGR